MFSFALAPRAPSIQEFSVGTGKKGEGRIDEVSACIQATNNMG
jgi:hypothetical protein